MSILLDNVRGTVQGVLAGVGHVLWYVNWHTGGQTTAGRARPSRARQLALDPPCQALARVQA